MSPPSAVQQRARDLALELPLHELSVGFLAELAVLDDIAFETAVARVAAHNRPHRSWERPGG